MVDVLEDSNEEFVYQIWDNESKQIAYQYKQAGRLINKIKELNQAI